MRESDPFGSPTLPSESSPDAGLSSSGRASGTADGQDSFWFRPGRSNGGGKGERSSERKAAPTQGAWFEPSPEHDRASGGFGAQPRGQTSP